MAATPVDFARRHQIKRIASLIFAFLAASACAGAEFEPIAGPPVRFEVSGFSIQSPPGTGWHLNRGASGITFAKQGSSGSSTHTIAASVEQFSGFDPALVGFAEYDTRPEVFAAYAKKATEEMNPEGGRMQFVEHTAAPDTQMGYCVKEYAKFEDHGSPVAPKVLIQEDWSYVCLHPDSPRVIVQAVFSERGASGERDPLVPSMREQFFQGLKFRALK